MQAASTRTDGPDRDTRLRLVSLETPLGPVEFGGGLACVRTPSEMRSAIAASIVGAVIGPRSRELDGTIEIAGRYVTLNLLPSPLLGPEARSTVDASLLDDLWREACESQRVELERTHDAYEAQRRRVDDAIGVADERIQALIARTPPPPPVDEAPAVDTVADRLQSLLDVLGGLSPVPVPAALALADAFDELAADAGSASAGDVDVDLVALERGVAAALRVAVAHAAGGVVPAAQLRIESCHRAVVDAERQLFEAGRRERPASLKRYQEALSDERAALAEAGVESYASYLVAIAAGFAPVDLEARLRAELELAQAEAARDTARAAQEQAGGLHEQRARELRADAVAFLGRMPGDDPATELRALREEHPEVAPTRDELSAALASAGVEVEGDPVATARAAVSARRAAPPVAAVEVEEPTMSEDERRLRAAQSALVDERQAHQAELDGIDAELALLDAKRALTVTDLDLGAVTLAVDALLDRYRAAEILAGRLPVVLDGALDDLDELVLEGLARHLAAVSDVQVIVVTARAGVAAAMAAASATTIVWPTGEGASAIDELSERERGMWCGSHLASDAVATCVHCGRPACLECIVYVPGETELWCVDCVEAQPTPNPRLLRRRRRS